MAAASQAIPSGERSRRMRSTIISVPIIAYKDWRICFDYGDEWQEERDCQDMQKEYPRKSDEVEKVKIW